MKVRSNGCDLLRDRCVSVQLPEDHARSLQELETVRQELESKWEQSPLEWEDFLRQQPGIPHALAGQFATIIQKQRGVTVPTSMRQVDATVN